MGKKISDLTAISGGTFATTDLFEISVDAGSGTFVSRKITGQEMIDSIGGDTNIGNSNLTIDVSGTRKLILGGALSTDKFAISNSSDTKTFFEVRGNGVISCSSVSGVATEQYIGGGGRSITSGYQNSAFGGNAGFSLTSGYMNTAVGYDSLRACNQGFQNVAVGHNSLYAVTIGDHNVGIGKDAGVNITIGNRNTCIGRQSGDDINSGTENTIVGNQAGQGITTGNYNTIVGKSQGLSSSLSNHVILNDGQDNNAFYRDNNDNVVLGGHSALSTTATNGFNYVRGGAGVPTGTPATSYTGHVPMYVDTTNNKMYIYSGGSWVALN